jgi:hypothetical protein
MDLQTTGGKPVTSENVPSIDNLRAHSPQIADHNRLQPDTPVNEARSSATRHNVKPDAADPGHHGCLPGHRPPNSSWDVRAASGASPEDRP